MKIFSVLLAGAVCAAAAAQTAAQGETETLGWLGQSTRTAKIYAKQSSSSRVYSKAAENQFLVINETESSNWYSVVLVNGQVGFVNTAAVAKLPYQVSAGASGTAEPAITGTGSDLVNRMLSYSMQFIGTPYKWGGNSLTGGVDCSGFVREVFKNVAKVNLPRTASEQAKAGIAIERLEHLRPGDRLYFWEKKRNKIGHTGIMLSGSKFIHSSSGKKGVAISDLADKKWQKILVAARRDEKLTNQGH